MKRGATRPPPPEIFCKGTDLFCKYQIFAKKSLILRLYKVPGAGFEPEQPLWLQDLMPFLYDNTMVNALKSVCIFQPYAGLRALSVVH